MLDAAAHAHCTLPRGNRHHSELIPSYVQLAAYCYIVSGTQPSSVGGGLVCLRIDRPTHVAPVSCFPFFSRTIFSRQQRIRQLFVPREIRIDGHETAAFVDSLRNQSYSTSSSTALAKWIGLQKTNGRSVASATTGTRLKDFPFHHRGQN